MLRLIDSSGQDIVILEPGNLKRLREGKPLLIQADNRPRRAHGRRKNVIIGFTPDVEALSRALTARPVLTAEDLTAALELCKNLPEVLR